MASTTFTNSVTLTDDDWFNDTDLLVYEVFGDGSLNPATTRAGARDNFFTGGTVTTNTEIIDASQTWNAGGVTFTAWKLNITDTASAAASLLLELQLGGTSRFNVTKAGQVQINDTTPNAKMTMGLTINQAGNDDELFAAKSSDVAHGMTDLAETDSYFTLGKFSGAAGGALIVGYNETTVGLAFAGRGVTDDTVKTTSATGYILFDADKKSGASVGSAGADANLMVLRNSGSTQYIWDAEGYFFAQGGIAIKDAVSAPAAVTGYAIIFVDQADGDLKVIFADGTTKTISVDT